MPTEIAPGDGEYLKRVGSAPVGADAEQLAADVDTAGVFQRRDALDADTAALVADSGSDTAQALSAQFAPLALEQEVADLVESLSDLTVVGGDGGVLVEYPPGSGLYVVPEGITEDPNNPGFYIVD